MDSLWVCFVNVSSGLAVLFVHQLQILCPLKPNAVFLVVLMSLGSRSKILKSVYLGGKHSWVFCAGKGTFLFLFLCFLSIFVWWPRCWIIHLLYWPDICVVNIAGIVCLLTLCFPALFSHNHHIRGVGSFFVWSRCYFFLSFIHLNRMIMFFMYGRMSLFSVLLMVFNAKSVKLACGLTISKNVNSTSFFISSLIRCHDSSIAYSTSCSLSKLGVMSRIYFWPFLTTSSASVFDR